MKIRLLFSIFFLITSSLLMAQQNCNPMLPRGGNQDWGTGAYYLPPSLQVKVYSNTSGDYYGTLVREPQSLRVVAKRNEWRRVDYSDQEWIGHHEYKYLKIKPAGNDEYVKVLWKTYKEERFMKKEELEAAGAIYYNYADYLLKENLSLPEEALAARKAPLGVNVHKWCVPLFASPDEEAEMIKCVYGNQADASTHTSIEIISHKEEWAQIRLMEWTSASEEKLSVDPCAYDINTIAEGWMKVIDDHGFPLIWYGVGY